MLSIGDLNGDKYNQLRDDQNGPERTSQAINTFHMGLLKFLVFEEERP
jgi:hypothetical protein